MTPPSSPLTWWVWLDWINDEVLALPATEVTPCLEEALLLEKLIVHHVEAPTRREAVRQAFPHRFEKPEEPEPGSVPPPSRVWKH